MAKRQKSPVKKKAKANNDLALWLLTGIVAILILAGSIFISMNQQDSTGDSGIAGIPVPVKGQDKPEPAPTATAKGPTRKGAGRQAQKETGTEVALQFDEFGNPVLVTGKLAGTLSLIGDLFAGINNKKLPLEHTCYRDNISPPVRWEGVPPATQSLVLLMERMGKSEADFLHWAVFNIPADFTGLPGNLPREGKLAVGGMQGVTDHNNIGYVGPCEPKGKHSYRFRLFALDRMLDSEPGAGKTELMRAMSGHVIDMTEMRFIHYFRL